MRFYALHLHEAKLIKSNPTRSYAFSQTAL